MERAGRPLPVVTLPTMLTQPLSSRSAMIRLTLRSVMPMRSASAAAVMGALSSEINRITVQGRIVKKPEMRVTQSGKSVASFTLAVERDYAVQGQERETDFLDVNAWNQTAEFVGKYLDKGSMAVVDGKLQIRNWTDKEGNKRRNAEIVAERVYFCGSKPTDGTSKSSYTAPVPSSATDIPEGFAMLDENSDDLPF